MFRLQVVGIITTVIIQVIFKSCWPDVLSAGVGANTDLTVGVNVMGHRLMLHSLRNISRLVLNTER